MQGAGPSGRVVAAALDLLAEEPPRRDEPVLRHPRVLLTPHIAYLSEESRRDYVLHQADNVVAWPQSGRPLTPVAEGPAATG